MPFAVGAQVDQELCVPAPPAVISLEQVLSFSAGSTDAARNLARQSRWSGIGRDEASAWGHCKGGSRYEVCVDLRDLASRCSCPSRKSPCKHALALMILVAESPPPALGGPPPWVTSWLAQREERKDRKPRTPADPDAQAKRRTQRLERMQAGLDILDLWLDDVIRHGLGSLEAGRDACLSQAARLVDAQAPGIASRVRALEFIIGSDPSWPQRALDDIGRIALLSRAFRRREELPPAVAADVTSLVGLTLREDDLLASGERLRDRWSVVAQQLNEEEHVRQQRSWLLGSSSSRCALVLQFAPGSAPFPEPLVVGSCFEGELVYWPGAAPQRARILQRGVAEALSLPLPTLSIEQLFDRFARELALVPFRSRTFAILGNVVPYIHEQRFWLCGPEGDAVELRAADPWLLLALSGGAPIDVVGEWDGRRMHAFSAVAQGRLYSFGGSFA